MDVHMLYTIYSMYDYTGQPSCQRSQTYAHTKTATTSAQLMVSSNATPASTGSKTVRTAAIMFSTAAI